MTPRPPVLRDPRERRYVLTDAQWRTLSKLTDAARLLAAALPPAYLATPIGPFGRIADDASAVLLTLDELP